MRKVKRKGISSDFEDAILLNNETYRDYLYRMKKIVTSMFEWKGLPDSMNARYLELCLYYKGQAALLYDNTYGFINTQAADSGYINIYGLPTLLNCYSYSFNANRSLYVPEDNAGKDEECILVMNNYDRVPTAATIELFALRLAEAQRTADVNIKAQRTPVTLLVNDKNKELTIRNLYAQYDGNSPVIIGSKDALGEDAIKAVNTDAPYIADKIINYKREIWNEFLQTIGVSAMGMEKKERMISEEANSSNELINFNLQSFLVPRQEAAKQFNQKFGTQVEVRVRSDINNLIKQYDSVAADYGLDDSEPEGDE